MNCLLIMSLIAKKILDDGSLDLEYCRAQGKGKIQKQKEFALKHDIKIGLPPTTHHHPPTRKLFLIPMDSRANSKMFLLMDNFFKTQAINRYGPFKFRKFTYLLMKRSKVLK